MAKHDSPNGVWVIPANFQHMFHEVFGKHVVRKTVDKILPPGRHRLDRLKLVMVTINGYTVFIKMQPDERGKFVLPTWYLQTLGLKPHQTFTLN